MRNPSKGVKVFAWLFIVGNIWSALFAYVVPTRETGTMLALRTLSVVMIVTVSGLTAGVGLLNRKEWARVLALALSVCYSALLVWQGMYGLLLVPLMVIWYFLRPAVKAQFQRR